jgi:hypothetical protein
MDLDFELYEGKKYSDLVKDIVKNHKAKQNQIKALTEQLVDMVEEPGDATMIVPLIKGYLDSDIKNDEALVKLAQIMQKGAVATATENSMLSDKDLELLFTDIQKSTTTLVDSDIKQLPTSK